jgi:hypothetical protein
VSDWWKRELENTGYAIKFWISVLGGDFINVLIIISITAGWIYVLFIKKISVQIENLNELILWVLVSFFIPTFTGLIRHFSNYDKTLRNLKKDYSALMLIENIIPILRDFAEQDYKKFYVVKNVFDKLPDDFGGIVIGADEKEYIKTLNELIPLTRKCFLATLRGGHEPQYTIGWFFQDSTRGDIVLLNASMKQEYLQKVKDAGIEKKKRIVILKENEMKDFCNDTWRDDFFRYNSNVEVYLIAPDQLIKSLVETDVAIDGVRITHTGETSFIWEDYAIFDSHIIVKHNGKNSLYLGVQDQIRKMLLPFELLNQQPQLFKKLDKDAIYSLTNGAQTVQETWNTWKKRNKK